MEDAYAAVGDGVRTAVRNPRLVAAAGLVLVVLLPVVAILGVVSAIATLFVVGPLVFRLGTAVLVKPLLFGGLAGAAVESIDGTLSGGAVFRSLDDGRGISLAGAYAVQEGLLVTAGVGLFVVHLALQDAGVAVGLSHPALQLVSWIVGAVGAALYLLVVVCFQFVDVVAVLDGGSARTAVERSYRLVRDRPGEAAGYAVLRSLLVAVCLLPGVVLAAVSGPGRQVFELAGWTAVALLLPFGLAAAVAAHVEYYRRRGQRRRPT